jgi:CheY-like chemotaxis protein
MAWALSRAEVETERKILAVEDDPDLLGLISRQLQGAGLEVWPVSTAEAALALVGDRGLPTWPWWTSSCPAWTG